MGKSDPYLKKFYTNLIKDKVYESVGLFGQTNDNFISKSIKSNKRYFYDMSLKNWNINNFPYNIDKKFDLILCTRCAYFAKDPFAMINSFSEMLKPEGTIIVDWGLGDHWRFKDFKVGWISKSEHEWCYEKDNYLWSTIWHNSFENNIEVKKFKEMIKPLGYEKNLQTIIRKEVPVILEIEDIIKNKTFKNIKYSMMTLWPDTPQLYIALILEK